MIVADIAKWAEANHILNLRELELGRGVWIIRKAYTHAICVGEVCEDCFDDQWCYPTYELAAAALAAWNPSDQVEPQGWIRHPASGRRRPAGDATKEFINH